MNFNTSMHILKKQISDLTYIALIEDRNYNAYFLKVCLESPLGRRLVLLALCNKEVAVGERIAYWIRTPQVTGSRPGWYGTFYC